MKVSPTENTLKRLRKDGYLCAVVEKWNHHVKIRQDLFGFIDVLGLGDGEKLAIQATTKSNISTRIKKIIESNHTVDVLNAGWRIQAWGWFKVKNRWQVKITEIRFGEEGRIEFESWQ